MVKSEEKKNHKIFLITQEIELAKLLAGNNKNVRDKALKNLKKWFYSRSNTVPFTEDDLQRIWKGLFYSMWMSDKPLIQEECAENISNLLHLPTYDLSILFFKAGLTILINEWYGIDHLRLDKFLMLVRRFVRHMFIALKEHGFSQPNIDQFNEVLSVTVLNDIGKIPLGLVMHFTEMYMEELAKVTEGHLHPDSVTELLRPFIRKLATTDDGRQVGQIRKFIFTYLIRQSDLGLEYQAKYNAWKQLGFPGSINSMQKIKLENDEKMSTDDEDEEINDKHGKPLDPRAGRIDVELPQIKFSAKKISEALMNYKFDKNSTKRGRNMITVLAKQFSTLANGTYPLGITELNKKGKDDEGINIRKSANKLIKFEQKLLGKDKKRKINHSSDEESSKAKKLKVSDEDETAADSISNFLANLKQNENDDRISKKKKMIKKKRLHEVSDIREKDENVSDDDLVILPGKILPNNNEQIIKQKNGSQTKSKKIIVDSRKQLKKIKSLQSKTKKIKKTKELDNIECVFERNSGTWVVFDLSREPNGHLVSNMLGNSDIDNISFNKSIYSENIGKMKLGNDTESREQNSTDSELQESALDNLLNNGAPNKLASPEKLKKPVKLFESPPRGRALFPRTEWDEALQEGEYEVFVPSKQYLKRIQKLAKKNNQKDSQVLVSPSQNNQVKSRRSLDPELIKNPFSLPSSRTKKVKINTKLNRSQEFYEHHMQIMSSPEIPHDPNKRPVKPVLKSPARTNSINPFYDKQLSVW